MSMDENRARELFAGVRVDLPVDVDAAMRSGRRITWIRRTGVGVAAAAVVAIAATGLSMAPGGAPRQIPAAPAASPTIGGDDRNTETVTMTADPTIDEDDNQVTYTFTVDSTGAIVAVAADDGSGEAIDPQIMSDVIDFAFPVGGDGMLRNMRLYRAIASIQTVDCGGKPLKEWDYTGDRVDQLMYPDLDLIRQKGLVELGKAPDDHIYGGMDSCRDKSLPSALKVVALGGYWNGISEEVWNRPAVQSEVVAAGKCLEQKVGKKLGSSATSKLGQFFGVVDNAKRTASNVKRYSGYYADCLVDYSAAMRAALKTERVGAVEKNKDVLISLAKELTAAGYVP